MGNGKTRSAKGGDYNRLMKLGLAAQAGAKAAKQSFLNP
jgi:hypothetical protein